MITGGPLEGYQSFLSRRIADSVRLAVKRLVPAKIGWGSVDEPSELFNRRCSSRKKRNAIIRLVASIACA